MTTMIKVEWSDHFCIGDDRVDQEHQDIFELVNELQSAIDRQESMDKLAMMLEQLAEHTIAHFQHEESLMQDHAYPGLDRHKHCHDRLIQKVTKLMQQFQAGETGAIQNLMNFLADWLRHHIKGEDQKMIQFMQQKHHQLTTVWGAASTARILAMLTQ